MKHGARSTMLLLAALLGGCIAPVPTESEQEMDSAPGKELVATITEDLAWPEGATEISGDMEITYQDDEKLEITANRHVVSTQSTFRVEVDQGAWQSIATDMAFVLYHRPHDGSADWAPVGCSIGSYGSAQPFTKDGVFVLWEKVKVDMSWRRFTGFNWLLKDAAFMEFENCGVMEASPDFGIVAVPMSNWNNMADPYSYSLELSY